MQEANKHALPGAANDTWRTWLMTGTHRGPVDRRRLRGAHRGLKRMLLEGVGEWSNRPYTWKDFSDAMVRHAVDDAIRSLPSEDKTLIKLAYFGGYSNRKIAAEVGMTEATVQRRLRRALSRISDHVQHGAVMARRATYALVAWLGGRWCQDWINHAAHASVVVAAAAIVASGAVAPAQASTPVPDQPVIVNPVVAAPAPAMQNSAPQEIGRPAVTEVAQPASAADAAVVSRLPIAVPVILPTVPPLPSPLPALKPPKL